MKSEKSERLFYAVGQVEDELIADAAPKPKTAPKRARQPVWLRWGAIAACLALIVFAGIQLVANNYLSGPLPMLTIESSVGGMGFEGYMAYDSTELVNANPWREDVKLTRLPVYENTRVKDVAGQVSSEQIDVEGMKALLMDVAKKLGLDAENLPVTDDTPDEQTQAIIREKFEAVGDTVPDGYFAPSMLLMEADGIKIEVDSGMTVTIRLDPAVALPQEYRFTYDASYEEYAAAAAYLQEQYSKLLDMKRPTANISGGDYSYDGQSQYYSVNFFDGSGNLAQQMVNYHFNNISFYNNDEGKLFIIRLFHQDLEHKVGDYPIITTDEARQLLTGGSYITTVPEQFPGLEYVAKTELVYRTGGSEKYYMPYYRFLVEMPSMEMDNGLKNFGAYYVPAVEAQYITNMPVWDGHFN